MHSSYVRDGTKAWLWPEDLPFIDQLRIKHEWLPDENVAVPSEMVAKAFGKKRSPKNQAATEKGDVSDLASTSSSEINISSDESEEPDDGGMEPNDVVA